MNRHLSRLTLAAVAVVVNVTAVLGGGASERYLFNRPPLAPVPYTLLPIGAIKPSAWLEEQLHLMRDGMTGRLDELYAKVVGPRNGWLGGDGDGWERGPYWIDGLLPLAYILDDEKLLAKVRPWIEWSLSNQAEDGYFGPKPFDKEPTPEPGIQKTPREDWWPKMVMLKVLQQYYMATGDTRVIELMTRYFRYQLKELPARPLGHYTFWGQRRGGDNLLVVYWLYNITGEKFLLELAELLKEQTYPYTDAFLAGEILSSHRSFHCVNLAQGIKQPVIYWQQRPEPRHLDAVRKAFADIRKFHGQPQGMYGADEPLHGDDPTKGSEFCSTTEMMYSLENMLAITGDVFFADRLEILACNALPTQANYDFTARQYYQQPNQVLITRGYHGFYTDDPYRLVFGVTTGYPCCTTNMHQGWPKFVQNLWYATADKGLAALVYAPCTVTARVADGVDVTIAETTDYPFDEIVRFKLTCDRPVEFPLHLRVPQWLRRATIRINDETPRSEQGGRIVVINRQWTSGDTVALTLPMDIHIERYHENSAAVERGPLVYALKIDEDWRFIESDEHPPGYYEVHPISPWNYGLARAAVMAPADGFALVRTGKMTRRPWTPASAPLALKVKGVRIPAWTVYNNMAGPLPPSDVENHAGLPPEEITLIPYGCTTLRISEFPVVR